MHRTVFGMVLAVSVWTPAALAADDKKLEFQKVASEAGRFSVEMPGKPHEKTRDLSNGWKDVQFSVVVPEPNTKARFLVAYIDVDDGAKSKDPQAYIAAFVKNYRKSDKIVVDKKLTLGKDKTPGREYRAELSNGAVIRERRFLKGARLYQTMIGVNADDEDFLSSKDAERFFDSFQITDGDPKK